MPLFNHWMLVFKNHDFTFLGKFVQNNAIPFYVNHAALFTMDKRLKFVQILIYYACVMSQQGHHVLAHLTSLTYGIIAPHLFFVLHLQMLGSFILTCMYTIYNIHGLLDHISMSISLGFITYTFTYWGQKHVCTKFAISMISWKI